MNLHNSRRAKLISIAVLFFFIWTFGGLYEIAYAAENGSKFNVQSTKSRKRKKRVEKEFEEAIEGIERALEEIEYSKDRREREVKKKRLRARKAEIERLDKELRKKFRETEEKIKDLPETIRQRHREFVRKYEENLRALREELEGIEKAKPGAEEKSAVKKAREHLRKAKKKKKQRHLDPDKLPHRTAKPVKKKPRLKKEEFGAEARKGGSAEAKDFQSGKPILVASNGPLAGLLNSTNSELTTQVTLLALADPPTDADLSETVEVQFTPAIQAKAAELGHNPVKIYNWVRNNVEFVPTYGSIQGADYCLQTLQCNAFDTASLLIALLRVSGIPARYVYGTVEIPIEKVMNWVGGFTVPNSAINLLASAGIPTAGMVVGGQIKYVRIEHIWVEAWIDYIPSRGARHKQGDTWIPLDASFKQYNYTQGIDIQTAVPFDAQSFIDQIINTATINEQEGYVTNVDSAFIEQTMTDYQTQVEDYITQNYPNATVGDVLGKKEIIKQEFPYLLGTLPYRVIVKGAKYSEIPDSLKHKITFKVVKDIYDELIGTPMNYSVSLPEIAGKKITLSYTPATAGDEAVIESYIPDPGPDGTIDPSELPTSLPAYLINVKPELRIDGQVVATGTTTGLGEKATFTMTFSAPNQSSDKIENEVTAGEYYGIAIDHGRISPEHMQTLKAKLEATKAKLEAQDFTGLTKDDVLGDLLYTTALSYYAELDVMEYLQAKVLGVSTFRLPSEAKFSTALNVQSIFGIPISVSFEGFMMDVDRAVNVTKSINGDKEKVFQFMILSGQSSSALEHSVPEQLFSTSTTSVESVSAVKALQIANDQGIPIYRINQSNMNTVLSQLQVNTDVKSDIRNGINAGKEVTISQTNITIGNWIGCGYIIIDPSTGNGSYMISGGLSGSHTEVQEDEQRFWDFLNTTFSLIGLKQSILQIFAKGSKTLKWIGFKIGVVGILLDLVIDLTHILNDDSLTTTQRIFSVWVVVLSAFLAILTIMPLITNPVGILVGFIYITVILFIINFIEKLALESIRQSGA